MAQELQTEDSQIYQFFSAPTTKLNFKVKAGHDAHIALSSVDDQEATPFYEIFVGGWDNTKSAIRRDRSKPDRAVSETPDILNGDESRGFWISWDNDGKIEVGREGESDAFLSYLDPEPFTISHYGVRTAWGATGEWEIEGGPSLHTLNETAYSFYPACQGKLLFSVRTKSNAHLALTNGANETEKMYEIFIGGWDNMKTAIRKNRSKPDVATVETPNIVTLDEYRGFELHWRNGLITLKDDKEKIIIDWQDNEPIPITYYGIRTAWGSTGDWKIGSPRSTRSLAPGQQAALVVPTSKPVEDAETPGEAVWIASQNGEILEGAVVGGNDHDCELIVARATHEGALLPGKMVPSHGAAYVSWDGAEHRKEEYEVLCGCKPNWVQVNQGDDIPLNALPGGRTADGETLFIGRVAHNETLTIGKVHPSHATCYIPYGGEELGFPDFEILVRQ